MIDGFYRKALDQLRAELREHPENYPRTAEESRRRMVAAGRKVLKRESVEAAETEDVS